MLAVRRLAGKVSVMVDLRGALVQSEETAAVVAAWTSRIYEGADRAGVIVSAESLGVQIKQATRQSHVRVFTDRGTAALWLNEDLRSDDAAIPRDEAAIPR